MANANIKSGLKPVRTLLGSPYNGQGNIYSFAAGNGTATFLGDPVKLAGTAQTINGVTYPDIVQAATGDKILGVLVSMAMGSMDTREALIYRAASTQRLAFVCDDPNVLYEIQESGGGTAFTINDIGLNANFVVGSGSTDTGLSGVEIDNSTEATTNTLDLKIVNIVNRPDNAVGENAKWLVRINRSIYVDQVAGT